MQQEIEHKKLLYSFVFYFHLFRFIGEINTVHTNMVMGGLGQAPSVRFRSIGTVIKRHADT